MANTQPNPAKEARNRILRALRAQQSRIQQQDKEIRELRGAVFTLAKAAGVGNHPRFAALRTKADGGNDPEGAPATTTEEAKTPQATDDVNNVGAAPAAANEAVTPDAVTDVQTTDVAVATEPLLDNLQDVTKPTPGTDMVPSGDAAHVETEVRVSAPTNDVMDPPGTSGWTSASIQKRFIASVGLARLRKRAGIDGDVDEMVAAQRIAESSMSESEISAESRGLSAALAKVTDSQPTQQHRHLVPRAAGVQPRPSLASTAPAGEVSEEFLFE